MAENWSVLRCPACGTGLRVPTAAIGRTAKCGKCNQTCTITDHKKQHGRSQQDLDQYQLHALRILDVLTPLLDCGKSLRDFFPAAERQIAKSQLPSVDRLWLECLNRTYSSFAVNLSGWQNATHPDVLKVMPLYEYFAVDDPRVRPHHWAFDGFVAPADWPGWHLIWPPNGFQCRCCRVGISKSIAIRRGLIGEEGRPIESAYMKTWSKAIEAELILKDGTLTYPREVILRNRTGKQIAGSFPSRGFDLPLGLRDATHHMKHAISSGSFETSFIYDEDEEENSE